MKSQYCLMMVCLEMTALHLSDPGRVECMTPGKNNLGIDACFHLKEIQWSNLTILSLGI